MRNLFARRTAAGFIFIAGLLLMLFGTAFLLGSRVEISQTWVLFSFFFVILGVGLAVLAIKLNKRSLYLFFAAFFLQVGLFLFLSTLHIIPVTVSRSWPLVSVFSGIALFPAGWHRYGVFSIRYAVPSAAFIILGSTLLVFSLNLVSFSFSQFVKRWWPLLVLLAGFILVLVSLSAKDTRESNR
jgi:hypothetical protein